MERGQADRIASRALVGVAVLVGVVFAAHAARAIAFPFPLDYGEGPLLEQGRRLAAGENIYRPGLADYPFTIANYPPLYPALIAILFKALGPSYVAARLLTFAAALACAAIVSAIVCTVTARRAAALVAGALFLASPYAMFWATLARIDFVALALSLGAVLVVARRPDARATPFVAAGLAALAALTRQSHLLAAPLAITGALVFVRPARAAQFVGTLALLVGLAVAALDYGTGGGFFFHTVTANANRYSTPLLRYFMGDLTLTTGSLLVFAAARALRPLASDRPRSALLVLYLAGTALSALTIGKVGSHVNYLLEIVAASAVVAGVLVANATDAGGWKRSIAAVLVLAQCAWLVGFTFFRPESLESKLAMRAEFEKLRDVVRAEPKPVLADETMGVLVIAGHPIQLQPFELTQLSRQGIWDESKLVADIRAQRFGLVLINDGPHTPDAWTRERWTDAMLAAVHEAYAPDGALAEATIYRPRPR